MRITSSFFKIFIAIGMLFSGIAAMGQEGNTHTWAVKLQKDYNKSYPVTNETLVLLSRYGKMNIETWDKNEIKVEAHISIGAQSNEYATQVLNRVNVNDEKKDDKIIFTTQIGSWSDNSSNGGHEMRIDYTVHVPANAKLYAENNYGPLTIGDYNGESELVCRSGTLTAGKLSNCKSVTVEYGRVVIESISDSKLLFRSSRVDIAKIAGKITGQFDYCTSVDMPVDNALKQLELNNTNTNLYLMAPADFSADYDITTSNARVTGKNNFVIKEEMSPTAANSRTNNFSSNHKYAGSLGKGGGAQINIKSNSGNIRVM
ncbi:MAG: hypothetical protein V4557_01740 [Bacteroidota bacterium]